MQLRAKGASDADVLGWALEMRAVCRAARVLFLLNDRAHLVEQAQADGVHLGQNDLPIADARALMGPDRILGLSTHTRDEVGAARDVDYLGLGPIFPTATKKLTHTPGGATLVASIEGATKLPVYPIGGITTHNVSALVAAGARRVAVSHAIWRAPDPREAARRFRALLDAR